MLAAVAVLTAGCGGSSGSRTGPDATARAGDAPVSPTPSSPGTGTATPLDSPRAETPLTARPDASPDGPSAGPWLIPTVEAGAGAGDHPPVLFTDGPAVRRLAGGAVEEVARIEPAAGLAVGDGAGTVVAERLAMAGSGGGGTAPSDAGSGLPATADALVVVGDAGISALETGPARALHLYDAFRRGGHAHVLYGRRMGAEEDEPSGPVVLHDLATGNTVSITTGFQVEFHTYAASAARDVLVTSAFSDLTESFAFHRYDGSQVTDRHNPTDELPYNAPPLLVHATLSPDGQRLAYLSGPDFDGATDQTRGQWQLVVADRDGTEILRLTVAGQGVELTHLDYDGRWALISAATGTGQALSPLLIDTTRPQAPARVLSAATGRATLDVPGPG